MSSEQGKENVEERVYIGNVDYKATESDLKEFFEGMNVTEVDIPSKTFSRGKKVIKKQLGFAFIQFESAEDASKAIEEYNGKEFKGRKIYVKNAVPPPTPEEKQRKIEEFKAKKADEKAKKSSEKGKIVEKQAVDETAKIENGSAKPKKSKKRSPKKTEKSEDSTSALPEENLHKVPEGKASTDTVFITNLDYKANVKTLNGIFKDLKPKWIHVPSRRVPLYVLKRQRNKGKTIFNKGIAFVKFSSEEAQKKAIQEYNGKEINGRKIIVDIAVDARIPLSEEAQDLQEAEIDESKVDSSSFEVIKDDKENS